MQDRWQRPSAKGDWDRWVALEVEVEYQCWWPWAQRPKHARAMDP